MSKKFISPYKVVEDFAAIASVEKSLLLFDEKLLRQPEAKAYIERFRARCALECGESLKALDNFPKAASEIVRVMEEHHLKKPSIFSLGGGSLGDFAGFFASVYKRGVPLYHIPSTFLAAIDSAHGSKNALNLGAYKNQIGTFYPAKKVYIVKSLLSSLSENFARDAFAEYFKMALIAPEKKWSEKLFRNDCPESFGDFLVENIHRPIRLKNEIVQSDPMEKKRLRYQLNLGHTLGHCFELLSPLNHGQSVAWGLRFAIDFSFFTQFLSSKRHLELSKAWEKYFYALIKFNSTLQNLNNQDILSGLRQDKKAKSSSVFFVFLTVSGARVKKVAIEEIYSFWKVWKRHI